MKDRDAMLSGNLAAERFKKERLNKRRRKGEEERKREEKKEKTPNTEEFDCRKLQQELRTISGWRSPRSLRDLDI